MRPRLEDEAQCLLVIIGATPEGKKELVGLADGLRESAHSWRDLLLDLKRRGLTSGHGCCCMMAPSLSRYLVTSATFSLNSTGLASFNASFRWPSEA
jgi:hypothetical protein